MTPLLLAAVLSVAAPKSQPLVPAPYAVCVTYREVVTPRGQAVRQVAYRVGEAVASMWYEREEAKAAAETVKRGPGYWLPVPDSDDEKLVEVLEVTVEETEDAEYCRGP